MKKWILPSIRILLGGVFLYAGITKVIQPQQFADSIATFQLLPAALINILALTLPPFEVILGAMLVIGWKTRLAALGTLVLGVVFAIGLVQGLARGLEIDCGCFGSGEPSAMKTWFSLGRDVLIMGASVAIYVSKIGFRKPRKGSVTPENVSPLSDPI